MYLPQYFALCRYLNKNPPTHMLLAIKMGIKGGGGNKDEGADHRTLGGIAAKLNKKTPNGT